MERVAAAKNTSTRELRLVPSEPRPLSVPRAAKCGLVCGDARELPLPQSEKRVNFFDILEQRRSKLPSTALATSDLARLLWHSARTTGLARDSVGIDRGERPYPSAGGLYEGQLLVVDGDAVWLYDGIHHALRAVTVPPELVFAFKDELSAFSARDATALVVVAHACTLDLAYENATSLLWRDAGGQLNTIHLVASAMGLPSKQLGILGFDLVKGLSSTCGNLIAAGVMIVGN